MALLSRIGCCLALAFALAGCAAARPSEVSWQDPSVDLVWPKPPETPRIRFLRSVAPSDFIQKEGNTKQLWRWMTGESDQVLPLVTPYGVAADGKGRIWVADTQAGVVHLFDLARQQVSYITTAGEERLVSPLGVAYDEKSGRLYVSDSQLKQVFALDEGGRLLGARNPPEGYGRPAGLATDQQGNLYVVDVLKGSVEIFSGDGAHLRRVTSTHPPEGGFHLPSNVFVDPGGRIYVTDSMNFRIEMFDPEGSSLGTIGQVGDGPGSFARPRGLAVDSEGHIYVADAAFDTIQIFDSAGRLLLFFGEPGKKPGQFSLLAGLFFDGSDRLYAVDAYNQRIQIFQYIRSDDSGH